MPLTLLDTNVLVHAARADSEHHEQAADLVLRGLSEHGAFCIAPQNLVEFAAVVTRPKFVNPALAPVDVRRMVGRWYGSRILRKIYPSRGTVLRTALEGTQRGISGPDWYDLFLAVTMRDNGVNELVTEDLRGFKNLPFVIAHRLPSAD